jgi:hypothetical protein
MIMSLPIKEIPSLGEIKLVQEQIGTLKKYKAEGKAIGLNGSTMAPDDFLNFFTSRGLPFEYYVNNHGVHVGKPSAYSANIKTLKEYIKALGDGDKTDCKATIKELKSYKAKFWGIGLNGSTVQPDNFNVFFRTRKVPFKPFVRSPSGVNIGEQTAYDINVATLVQYMADIDTASKSK